MRKCKCWSSQTCTAVITVLYNSHTHICPYKHRETRAGRQKIFSTVFLSSTRSFRITGQSEELNMTTFNLKTGLNCWSVEPAVFTLESLSDPLTDIFFFAHSIRCCHWDSCLHETASRVFTDWRFVERADTCVCLYMHTQGQVAISCL